MLHMAGQVGTDASGKTPDSLVEQMKNAYQHVESVLKEFGCTMDNVVEDLVVTDMHECMTQVQDLFAARQEIYGKPPEVAQHSCKSSRWWIRASRSKLSALPLPIKRSEHMPELQHLPADADARTIVAAVEQDGAVILDNVISPEFIAALREETDPYMDNTSNGKIPSGFSTTRTGGLLIRSEKCRQLIEHETILNPCREFLAPFCEKVQLHLTQIIRIRPGETTQAIHRDKWAWGKHLCTSSLSSTPFGRSRTSLPRTAQRKSSPAARNGQMTKTYSSSK